MQIIDVLIVGDSGVGKTTLLNNFNQTQTKVTKSSSYGEPEIQFNMSTEYGEFTLNCFVIMKSPLDRYYDVACVIVDIQNKTSIQHVFMWCEQVRKYRPKCEIIICANKSDHLNKQNNNNNVEPYVKVYDPFKYNMSRILTLYNAQYCEISAISKKLQILPLLGAIKRMIHKDKITVCENIKTTMHINSDTDQFILVPNLDKTHNIDDTTTNNASKCIIC